MDVPSDVMILREAAVDLRKSMGPGSWGLSDALSRIANRLFIRGYGVKDV